MPMSSMDSFGNDSISVDYSGSLRSERQTSLVRMSGPLYVARNPENSFRPTPATVVHDPTLPTTKKYPSISSAERNDYEHLLKSGQLGICNDPYCTTYLTYCYLKSRQKNSMPSDIFDHMITQSNLL